jgi:putative membrane protein
MPISQEERLQINELVARFEADTGIQAVAAVTEKADAYPDIPWKAYAIGSGIGALAAAFNPFFVAGWSHASLIALDAMLILTGGAVLTLLSVFIRPVGRLFLDRMRARAEALQYAQSLFLERELFRTYDRRSVLVVMCCFERLAVVLADSGLNQYAPADSRGEIGAAAGALLAKGAVVPAFECAFSQVQEVLQRSGFTAAPPRANEIADDVVLEKGA